MALELFRMKERPEVVLADTELVSDISGFTLVWAPKVDLMVPNRIQRLF